jgi:hypothetical protein
VAQVDPVQAALDSGWELPVKVTTVVQNLAVEAKLVQAAQVL